MLLHPTELQIGCGYGDDSSINFYSVSFKTYRDFSLERPSQGSSNKGSQYRFYGEKRNCPIITF